jgi:hypothetical protein
MNKKRVTRNNKILALCIKMNTLRQMNKKQVTRNSEPLTPCTKKSSLH